MAGKLAEPYYINGGDDDLLVGDSAAVVAAEAAAVNAEGELATFDALIPEVTPPEKQEAMKSEAGKSMSSTASEVNSSPGGAAALNAVANIPTNDVDKANEVVNEMKEDGSIDSLEGNTKAIDKLSKAVGLEKRLKDIAPEFSLDDYNNKVKLNLLKEYDWSTTQCDKSMKGLLSNMSSLFPDVLFGSNDDDRGRGAAKDASLLAALRCGAKWLTDDSYDSILDEQGPRLEGLSTNFMETTLTDFQSDKQVRFVRKVASKLKTNNQDKAATEYLTRFNPKLVPDILRVYPWGFMDSFNQDIGTAHDALVQALDDIDPDWFKVNRNGTMVNDLTHYYRATDEALYVLGYKKPHTANVAIVGSHRKISYTIYPQHIRPRV